MPSGTELAPNAACREDELLGRYVRAGDDQALTELIKRFAPAVYAAARRQVRDPSLAEDVMQNVFITFARKARGMRSGAAIGSWLLQTTRYTAANAMRIEARRRRHELAAAAGRNESVASSSQSTRDQWQTIAPLLDGALARLNAADQKALVLRFFQNKSFGEIAAVTGATEDTARKRLVSAVARLRKQLLSAGADASACADGGLMALLASHGAETVPAHLLAQSISAAGAVARVTGHSFITGVIAMTAAKKIAAGIIIAIILLGGASASMLALHYFGQNRADNVTLPAGAQASLTTAPPAADWHEAFYAAYRLSDNQAVKFIAHNVIPPERRRFYRENLSDTAKYVPYPDRLIFQSQPDGTVKVTPTIGPDMLWTTAQALISGLRIWQLDAGRTVLNLRLTGDWVVRPDATPDDILAAMAAAVNDHYHYNVVFKHEHREVEAVLVSGQTRADCNLIALPFTGEQSDAVHLAHDDSEARAKSEPVGWEGVMASDLDQVSLAYGIDFILADSVLNDPTRRKLQGSRVEAPEPTREAILEKLSQQTGLTFTPQKQTVDVWKLEQQ